MCITVRIVQCIIVTSFINFGSSISILSKQEIDLIKNYEFSIVKEENMISVIIVLTCRYLFKDIYKKISIYQSENKEMRRNLILECQLRRKYLLDICLNIL